MDQRPPLRLLADDLTGALDSAAAFASPSAPVAVGWRGVVADAGAVALDSRTREVSADEAHAAVALLCSRLFAPDPCLAFKKIDSLLRGQAVRELQAILAALQPTHCIIAPAFPAQGRVTRGGRQYVRQAGEDRAIAVDLGEALERIGHPVARHRPGSPVPNGVSLWDADSDADLDAIVAAAAPLARVVWVGSAGLATALARAHPTRPGDARFPLPPLPAPVLGLVGSDHDVMRAQLAHLTDRHRILDGRDRQADVDIARCLAANGAVFVSVDLPAGTARHAAAALIEHRFASLIATLDRPGTLVAAGGETLRGLCEALRADRLDVIGEVAPGVPRSILRGGRWDGVTVVSKSGAFGGPDLLTQFVAATPAAFAGAAA